MKELYKSTSYKSDAKIVIPFLSSSKLTCVAVIDKQIANKIGKRRTYKKFIRINNFKYNKIQSQFERTLNKVFTLNLKNVLLRNYFWYGMI